MRILTHFVCRILLFSFCVSNWSGCTDDHGVRKVREQYPDGIPRVVASLKGNQLHGRSLAYYPNGTMRSSTRWLDGKRTGVSRLYYHNGTLKDSSYFVNDSLHGLSLQYYRNGALERRAYFTNGTSTGTMMFFDSLGKPLQRHIYDSTGELIYFDSYDKYGQHFGRVASIFEVPDTVDWGKPYAGCVRFGYPLTGRVTMLVGPLVTHPEALDRYQIADTLVVVHPDARGRFCFSYLPRPVKPGRHLFGYKFLNTGNAVDSMSVDGKSGTVPFFVRRGKETRRPSS